MDATLKLTTADPIRGELQLDVGGQVAVMLLGTLRSWFLESLVSVDICYATSAHRGGVADLVEFGAIETTPLGPRAAATRGLPWRTRRSGPGWPAFSARRG
ncbi:hypothetical protein [Nocardia spumae]|uniref:hypothetical protein n=1 Tax=Nocardia spumae TaxID=2887190 RepID=UPI001D146564|nr:hypothetical protein [Nocardia spumae]